MNFITPNPPCQPSKIPIFGDLEYQQQDRALVKNALFSELPKFI